MLVHRALHSVQQLFQVWASKHVLGIAGMMSQESTCPSCQACKETCAHIANCPEAGRTKAFSQLVAELYKWMKENKTHPDLAPVILDYAQGRGKIPCIKCAGEFPSIIQELAILQDRIGWGNFMVGMISAKLFCIQDSYLRVRGLVRSSERWAKGLTTQLLQITHGQWIYRCVLVHDHTTGTLVYQHKAELLEKITKQMSMGAESLMEDDKYLLECNPLDIVTTNSKQQEYWLLAIQAAREASQLRKQAKQQQLIQISLEMGINFSVLF